MTTPDTPMQTVTIKGVEHVQLALDPPLGEMHRIGDGIAALAKDLGRHPSVCGLCVRYSDSPHNCEAPGYLVEASLYPILKMRLEP